ncbi:MAG: YggT family protein, partial [Ilumatobacter sp.]|nr:YggT family protein [Ilumatobacter sp.]
MVQIIELYTVVVFVSVVVSWMRLPMSNPIAQLAHTLTEPALAPIRKLVPPVGGLDFSPMVLLIGLQ